MDRQFDNNAERPYATSFLLEKTNGVYLPQEIEQGNIEYKLQIGINTSKERIEKLFVFHFIIELLK